MTSTDGRSQEAAAEDEADDGPPYSRLDEETAAKCGLWLE